MAFLSSYSSWPGRPQVVFGMSGVGKTSLLAAAVMERYGRSSVTVVRFCGTSPGSADAPSLLRSLCAQVSDR